MHEITLRELQERLSHYDEMTLLELLELDSSELVELLVDVIEEKYDELLHKLPEDDNEEDE